MKLITGVVRPTKVDEIREALARVNVVSMTVVDVKDHSPHNTHTVVWRAHAFEVDVASRVEIHVVAHDDDVDAIVSVIIRAARTRGAGDGHVSVMPVEHRYNIHSGERELS